MKSIGQMLICINGLVGTKDLNAWETDFVTSVHQKYTKYNADSSVLTDKQVEHVEQIYIKHFA